jgi:phage baseplate assembly protein W
VLNFVKLYGGKLTSLLYVPVCIATKTSIKHKALSVSEKLEFIKKVDAQTHLMDGKVVVQLTCQRQHS